MSKSYIDVQKDITGASEQVTEALKSHVISPDTLLYPFLDKVDIVAGVITYPFIDVVNATDTSFVLGGITLDKVNSFSIAELTHETAEDASPKVGMVQALSTVLGIKLVKQLEDALMTKIRTDLGGAPFVTTVDWTGIKEAVVDMGAGIYTIEGSVYVGLSLTSYLEIIGDDSYKEAKEVLGPKLKLVVSEFVADNEMIVFHEHGVAGGFLDKAIEVDPKPALDATHYVAPYTYAVGWDAKYIRFISV